MGHGYTLGVSSARCVAAGPAFPMAPDRTNPVLHAQAIKAEARAATASMGNRDTWRGEQLAAGGTFDHRIQSNRLPRLSTPCCSSLGSAAWTGVAYVPPPPRKLEVQPEKRPTVDVHWCVSPRVPTAEVLAKHEDALLNAQRLRIERTDLFATLKRIHERQLEIKAAARPRSVQTALRLDGKRMARPAWGGYDYKHPVGRGHQVARS